MAMSALKQIGAFEVQREIGRGAMGVVYLARDRRLNRNVAIKVLPDAVSSDPTRVARFRHEGRSIAALNHPNIAVIHDIEECDALKFLVLEYVEGETLEQRLRNGAMPLEEALRVCRQIAAGTEAAHKRSIIHRDLKPANIKVTPGGHVKILDFGLAKMVAEERSEADLADATTLIGPLSMPGVIAGTPGYMSPEQARGEPVDQQTDVWSFGCVLFECLVGAMAFPGKTANEAIAATLTAEPQWDLLPSKTPNRIRNLLRHCLKKDPNARLRDMGMAGIQIEEAMGHRRLPSDRRESGETPDNLPAQVTSFVGRTQQLAELRELLSEARLVTITGSGGCGKTRLALQLAAELVTATDHADGVWYVGLASLADPVLVPQYVATSLGVKEQPGRALIDTLINHLKEKTTLLVIDNCEHMLSSCAELANALLHRCPHLQIIATSREALGIAGETTFRVPSLTIPPSPSARAPDGDRELLLTDQLQKYEAVELFTDRAKSVKPAFTITDHMAEAVARICRRLDGIPLAIELAAARIRALSVEQIARRLDESFRILAGGSRTALPRHRTLRGTIEWSYNLLSQEEQILFRPLSVFTGGWSLEAGETVCSKHQEIAATPPATPEDWQFVDLLTSLVDKSLVVYEDTPDGEGRYHMLQTVHQYVLEELNRAHEGEGMRDRHLEFFLALAEMGEPQLRGPNQGMWLERLERDHENLLAALEWCRSAEGGAVSGLRLSASLWQFWYVRGHLRVGRSALEAALDRKGAAEPTALRAKALNAAGGLAGRQCDYALATAMFQESLAVRRRLGDKQGIAQSLNNLGIVLDEQGESTAARALYEEAVAINRELGNRIPEANNLNNLGNMALALRDYATAKRLLNESLVIYRELEHQHGVGLALTNLGLLAHCQGDNANARSLFEDSLAIRRKLRDKHGMAESLQAIAAYAAAKGESRRVTMLFGAAERLREEIGSALPPRSLAEYDRDVAATRNALGEEAFETAWAEGRTISLKQMVQDTLAWLHSEMISQQATSLAESESTPDG